MTTSSAAEKIAAPDKKEEKLEKRRALGRGLESLLPGPRVVSTDPRIPGRGPSQIAGADNQNLSENAAPHLPPDTAPGQQSSDVIPIQASPANPAPANFIVNIPIDRIDKNPYQTRSMFAEETLLELRDSIKEHGVVQPVVVRQAEEEGRYILVLGERRLRASKMAGNDTIPAQVRRLSPQQAAEMTVLENVVREDLNPIEQAEAFRVLSLQFKLTQVQIAERIGISRESVSNYMRLLRLPRKVMDYMISGRLSFSDAREILRLENERDMEQVAEEVVTHKLKWDQIEDRVMQIMGALPPGAEGDKKRGSARWLDPNVRAAQTEMERTLGMRVRIRDRNGKGKIVIEYSSVDDYERVTSLLKQK